MRTTHDRACSAADDFAGPGNLFPTASSVDARGHPFVRARCRSGAQLIGIRAALAYGHDPAHQFGAALHLIHIAGNPFLRAVVSDRRVLEEAATT
jgi:hypothetical protein